MDEFDVSEDEQDQSEEAPQQAEAPWLTKLRAEAREARKLRKEQKESWEPALQKLQEYESRERISSLEKLVTEVGGKAVHAKILPADIDPTPEAVRGYLESLELISTEPSVPITVGTGQSASPGRLSYAQYREMVADPSRQADAVRMSQAGLVDWNER